MANLIRFGVSLEKSLLEAFDHLIHQKKYPTRSKAIADLIRKDLVREQRVSGKEVAGAILLIYNHHKRRLLDRLMHVQHDFHRLIISTQHIHLDGDNCLEIIVVRGKSAKIETLTHLLQSTKGVEHCSVAFTARGAA